MNGELGMTHGKTAVRWRRRILDRWGNGLRELVIIGLVFGGYRLTGGILGQNNLPAFQNAYDILNLERALGLFVEHDFQYFFLGSTFLIHLVNTIYTVFYYPVLVLFAIWAYKCHRQHYYTVRNVFIVSAGLAFLCFALYPVAPPRLLPFPGFADTMAHYGFFDYSSQGLRSVTNPYAAMPSLHFAWAFLIGVATICIARAWWLKLVGALLPVGMFVAIIATGNHFVLDAVGGALLIGMAYGLVLLFPRLREQARVYGGSAGFVSGGLTADSGEM